MACGTCIRWRRVSPKHNFGRCFHPRAQSAGAYWTGLRYPMLDGSTFTPESSPLLHTGHGADCPAQKAKR